jgi:serine/threonine-protein kinase
MSAPSPSADRNLIFGLLALQIDFVSREQLLDAMHAWMLDKHTPLGDVLCRRGVLAEDEREVVDLAVDKHIKRHGGDPQASLAALHIQPQVRQQLDCLEDPDVQASLASLPPTPVEASAVATMQGAWDDSAPLRTPPPPAADSTIFPAAVAPTTSAAAAAVRYRRLRAHARGGLGEVFVALDEELSREVALKEIQEHYADRPDARARFVREAKVTGKLEHPGVVPVYGLGTYEDGRPFYAMRLIRGESMQDAIRRFHKADGDPGRDPGERSLALRELLGRFVAVCNAVAYAHARGVIHRDLKPANAMLGEYGETLVVDWGLARVLDQPPHEQTTGERPVQLGSDSSTAETEMGQVIGTPAYMAPEQAEGRLDRVGVGSDVFALGGTLYCLLTGQGPYVGEDVLGQARRGEVVPARQRKRSVPAALEAVCQKAMAAPAEQRYSNVRALAEEVQRWLADEPVSAYREPLADRARRWGRRHRSTVTGGVAVLLLGVVGLGLGLWLVNQEQARTAQQRDRAVEAEIEARTNLKQAEANLKLARQAIGECFNIARTDRVFQGPRMEQARNLLLRKTLPFYKNFREQRPDDRALQQEEALQWFRVGYIEKELLRANEAKQAYERARGLFEALVKAHPHVHEYQNDLARTYNHLGIVLYALGKREEALKQYHQSRDLKQKLVNAHPEVRGYQVDLAATCCNLGHLLRDTGKPRDSLSHFDQAVKLLHAVRQDEPNQPTARRFLRNSHWGRAQALTLVGRHREAAADWDQALLLDTGPPRLFLQLRRADSRARAGDYRGAAAEAEALGRAPSLPGATLYELACIHALNAASAARDLRRPLAERDKRAQRYARQAVALLKRAALAGFFRDPVTVAHMDMGSDLAALRDRDDYKQFRAGLK